MQLTLHSIELHVWRNRIRPIVDRNHPLSQPLIALMGERSGEERIVKVQSQPPSSWPPNSCTRVDAFTWKSRNPSSPRSITFPALWRLLVTSVQESLEFCSFLPSHVAFSFESLIFARQRKGGFVEARRRVLNFSFIIANRIIGTLGCKNEKLDFFF